MFCQTCGADVQDFQRFCPRCGSPQPAGPTALQPYVAPMVVQARTSAWIGAGWNLVKANFGISIAAIVIIGIINSCVPFILAGPSITGLHYMYSRALKGHRPDISDVFHGFQFFVPSLVAGILITFFTTLGYFFLIVPGLIIAALFSFTYLFISDKKMDFWPAMMASKDLVMKDLPGFVWMLVLGAILLNLLGVLVFLIGVLVTAPIYFAAVTIAYHELVGLSEPRT